MIWLIRWFCVKASIDFALRVDGGGGREASLEFRYLEPIFGEHCPHCPVATCSWDPLSCGKGSRKLSFQ